MNYLSSFGVPFADVTDLFSHSDLEGFPIDRPYTKTRMPLTPNSQRREIGHLAVWTLSSARPEQGVEQLRDDNLNTYWQSDGAQPHTLTIYFPRKTAVSELCLYMDFKADESYTPSKLAISLGNTVNDLWEIQTCDLDEPVGWYNFALGKLQGGLFQSVSTHYVQLCILQNQHNGRDTHLRQVKIFGPREDLKIAFPSFTTTQYSQYTLLR
jgi:anaphase-promoting complex subunit 10